MNLLEVKNICKTYGSGETTVKVLSAGFYVEQKCFAKGNPYICWFQ